MEHNDAQNSPKQLPEKVEQIWSIIRQHATSEPQSLHGNLKFLKSPDNVDVTFDEAGEGLMNYIFRLVQKTGGDSKQRAIVKNTCDEPAKIDFSKVESGKLVDENNEEFKINLARMIAETRCLEKFNDIMPGTAPKVYMTDTENNYFIMEDLFKHKVLSKVLCEPLLPEKEIVRIMTAIAKAIAAIHQATHRQTLSPEQFDLLETEIGVHNEETMREKYPKMIRMLLLDSNCQMLRHDLNELVRDQLPNLYEDKDVEASIEHFIDVFVSRKECLIHNDFHTGGIMVHDTDVKFIDTEFAMVGLPERDVGLQAADIISYFYVHQGNNPKVANKLRLAFETFLNCYMREAEDIITDTAVFFENVSCFTAERILFRILMPASVPGLDKVPVGEAECFKRGVRMFKNMTNIHSINAFMALGFD